MAKHTLNELGNMSREELITIILSMQGQLDALNENIEKLIEQVRLANSYRFGRHTETLKSIDGQLSFFDEAETLFDASAQEPSVEEAVVVTRKKKSKGQRELNLKAFPEEAVPVHSVSVEQLDFAPFVERMKQELLSLPVTQADETPTQVIRDSDHPNSKCYMWVHRSGEFHKERPIVVYEYQKGRDHQKPLDFYRDYKGILVTDGLQQYHLVAKKLPDVTNANCWAHARRDFADAVKAMDKKAPSVVRESIAYQALQKIAEFYNADTELKGLPCEERLQKRQEKIRPLVEEFFAWVKEQAARCVVPPKSKTGQGLQYLIHQEPYLKVFLTDGDVPIDNSASERAIRTFCIGKKNWMFHNTANGAWASALIYSISETVKLNGLRPYYYFRYILTELPKLCDEQGNLDPADLEHLMPWSPELPEECRKPRR